MLFILMCSLAISFTVCDCLPASENGPCWVDGSVVNMGCIHFNTDSFKTWDEAAAFCLTQHGSKLVAIETEQQMEFISQVMGYLEYHNWWTSGTDRGREGEWYWASTLNQVHLDLLFVKSFNSKNPQKWKWNCLSLRFTSRGNYEGYDQQCDSLHRPICQINH